jgi:hypothetical protein
MAFSSLLGLCFLLIKRQRSTSFFQLVQRDPKHIARVKTVKSSPLTQILVENPDSRPHDSLTKRASDWTEVARMNRTTLKRAI